VHCYKIKVSDVQQLSAGKMGERGTYNFRLLVRIITTPFPLLSCAARLLTVKFRQPSHEFTFGVGMTFISYPLVLTPLV
jgi:hypothetical protein